jgi:Asp-tRNA(Asn)/Glu-tRNA(Gln) amidotransferase A subunit family amidase
VLSLRHLPLTQLAERLANGALSAGDLLREGLAAAERHADLGAVLAFDPRAMAEADACDAERRTGRLRGPLHGAPIIVKDNIDVLGLPTSSGNRAMAHAMPIRSAAQVVRLQAAGAIIVGKSNLSEFSFEIRSRSSLGGDVRNPFLRDATSGGSSGGTAVAVAAGFVAAGLGTDTGGSIRVPASYTGLVGLRPTHGVLDIAGVAPLAPSTDTIGPITRTVADARLLFGIMGGSLAALADRARRVGVLRQAFGSRPDVIAAAETACDALRVAGVDLVDPVALPEAMLPIDRPHIVDAEFADAFDAYLAHHFEPGSAPVSLAAILASGAYLSDYRAALERRLAARGAGRAIILAEHRRLGEALAALMEQHRLDAILHPTSMVTPASLDNPKGGWGPELAACSGWPALSVPAGVGDDGIPIGVELLGRPREEPVLLHLGQWIEQAVGPRRIPPLD